MLKIMDFLIRMSAIALTIWTLPILARGIKDMIKDFKEC